jgi:uncharacterized protein YggE
MPRSIRPTLTATAFAAVATLASAAYGQGAASDSGSAEPRVVVSATRTTRLTADRARLEVLVEGRGETPDAASQRAEVLLLNVREALRQLGTRAETLGTTPAGITTLRIGDLPTPPGESRYAARHVVTVSIPHLGDLADVSTAALAAGATASATTYEAAASDSVRRAGYADAVAQAQRDAEAIATSLGGRLGPVIEVSSAPPASAPSGSPGGSPGGSPSDLTVTAAVTVRYRLLRP